MKSHIKSTFNFIYFKLLPFENFSVGTLIVLQVCLNKHKQTSDHESYNTLSPALSQK
jgi:hypothetical protein